jgi:streptogramin lyase
VRPNPLGTGARGQEWKDGKLWFASGPARKVFRIDPQKWVVELEWPVVGDRAHGLGWEGDYLWVADGNLKAFHKHDSRTGQVIEQIKLESSDPEPHGLTIWDGYLWYSDTVTGSVLRAKLF